MQINGVIIEREAISKIESGDRFVTGPSQQALDSLTDLC